MQILRLQGLRWVYADCKLWAATARRPIDRPGACRYKCMVSACELAHGAARHPLRAGSHHRGHRWRLAHPGCTLVSGIRSGLSPPLPTMWGQKMVIPLHRRLRAVDGGRKPWLVGCMHVWQALATNRRPRANPSRQNARESAPDHWRPDPEPTPRGWRPRTPRLPSSHHPHVRSSTCIPPGRAQTGRR